MNKIDQLEQLEKAATPKPWVAVKKSLVLHKNGRIDAYGIVRPIPEGDCLFEDGNAEFIAAARNAMPDLINEVRRAQADIEDLQNELLLAKALNNQLKGELETLKKLISDIDEADKFEHDPTCEIWYKSEGVDCNCGLFELQTRLYKANDNLL